MSDLVQLRRKGDSKGTNNEEGKGRTGNRKVLVFPNIPAKFTDTHFPEEHVVGIRGFSFPRETLEEAWKKKQLLTMDFDAVTGSKIHCTLRCGWCFNPVAELKRNKGELISPEKAKETVREAVSLGLKAIRLIGPGEPIEDPKLLEFLEFLIENGIQYPCIFTKVTTLGDDSLSQIFHKMKAIELARKLKEMGVTILLGSNSFDPETQDDLCDHAGYAGVRNRALENLVEAGFGEFVPNQATDLALIFNPIMRANSDEAFEVYRWVMERNIVPLMSATMIGGKCREDAFRSSITPDVEELVEIFTKINLWAFERGALKREEVEENGIAPYAGTFYCPQLGAGLFVRADGIVLRCPGDDVSIQGDLKKQSLTEIWEGSENRNVHAGHFNPGCPPKMGKSFPNDFFEKVLEAIRGRNRPSDL